MRSPKDMMAIQIDITNACNKACSNCTRFCGNHKKPFFMDYDTFKLAVDSLEGYEGVTGVIGGEPTVHPEFERFVLYLQEKYGKRKEENRLIYPQKNFIKEVQRREFESHIKRNDGKNFRMYGPGLWSNMGKTYPRYYEIIQDTFNVQFLNDHINPSFHQPGLISRKDLGITDEEWIPMRDRCWVQNEWSATITPKGAFFCEIAGALDILFNGPGGWKVEPGWWKRTPEEFGSQLKWCEICGFALDTFMRNAEEEIDDVSPTLYEMLKKVGSPRVNGGKINKLIIQNGEIAEESKASGKAFAPWQPYLEHYEDRFNESNSVLFARKYDIIDVSDCGDFGRLLKETLDKSNGWIVIKTGKEYDQDSLIKYTEKYIMNPGTFHIGQGYVIINKYAESLKKIRNKIEDVPSVDDLKHIWEQDRVISLYDVDEHNNWNRKTVEKNKRYALWGTGLSGSFLADMVTSSGGRLVFCIDKNIEKIGQQFYGVVIYNQDYLIEHEDEYDYLLIGHYSLYEEIKSEAISMGVSASKIKLPYEM